MGNLKGRKLKENKRSGIPTRTMRAMMGYGVVALRKIFRIIFHKDRNKYHADCKIMLAFSQLYQMF